MKTLITGVAGTGKSTISKALNKKGIFSIDFSDIPDMCYWRDKATKEKVEHLPNDNIEWFDFHERICDLEKLKSILSQHKDLVVTGIASGNQMEYMNFFDKVFLLQCSPETIIHRMQTRETSWGKTKAEQDHTLQWQKEFETQCLSIGLPSINTESDIEDVVEKVITQLK